MEKLSVTQIRQLNSPYLDKWEELCREMDRYIVTPVQQGNIPDTAKLQGMFSMYGTWETIKDEIDTCMADESYYKNQYDDLEKEKEDIEEKYKKLQKEIANVSSDLETIVEIDTTEPNEQGEILVHTSIVESIDKDISTAIKRLDELSADGWSPEDEYKKTKGGKK